MKRNFLLVFCSAVLMGAPTLSAQGGGSRGGGAGQQGQRGGAQQGGIPGGQEKTTQGRTGGGGDRVRDKIHATDQQRDQLRTCDQTADRARAQAKSLRELANVSGSSNADVARQRDRLREQIQTLEREHNRFITDLDGAQKDALKKRIQDLDRSWDRVNNRLREMDRELAKSTPDRTRLADQARELEQDMNRWQEQYRGVQSEIEP